MVPMLRVGSAQSQLGHRPLGSSIWLHVGQALAAMTSNDLEAQSRHTAGGPGLRYGQFGQLGKPSGGPEGGSFAMPVRGR